MFQYHWLGFGLLVAVLLALDLGVFHRKAHDIRLREAAGWSIFWVSLGASFSGVVFGIYQYHWFGAALGDAPATALTPPEGLEALLAYLTGFVLEKALSVDNLFVIASIFTAYKIQGRYQHHILFWGIVGAIVLRGAMIWGGVWLVSHFTWIFYVFGGYLVYTGLKLAFGDEHESDPEKTFLVRTARRILPVANGEFGERLLTRENGKLMVTTPFLALVSVEFTDVVFALDSVPAVLAVTTEPFIVVTSNIFAILGLRALYFVLRALMDEFRYLDTAVAVILTFIGVKMILHGRVDIPQIFSLGFIAACVAAGLFASHWANVRDRRRADRGE